MLTRRRFAALSAAVAGATLAAPLKARASATRSGIGLACRFLMVPRPLGPAICPPRSPYSQRWLRHHRAYRWS